VTARPNGRPRGDRKPAAGDAGAVAAALPKGAVVSVNVAAEKGVRKEPRAEILLVADHGVEGDGHAGPWHRQVSLLARESIATMRARGLDVGPGDFAENVTTEGVAVAELPLGTLLHLGGCLVELTQIGKVCHDRCAIFRAAGDCVMPREGVFVRVLQGGPLRAGDEVAVVAMGGGAHAAGAAIRPEERKRGEPG
jgi:MOSC domain-containing protein YiiM